MNNKNKIKKIATHYCLKSQLKKLAEECAELIQAAMKKEAIIEEGNKDITSIPKNIPVSIYFQKRQSEGDQINVNLAEEIADVEIMIEQIKFLIPEIKPSVKEWKRRKLDRQISRMQIGE